MRTWLSKRWFFAALVASAPLAAHAQPDGASLTATPQGFKALNAWPNAAGTDIDQGIAVTRCILDTSGKFGKCAAIKENPAGRGFGDMAVKLTSKLTNHVLQPGAPVETTFFFLRTETAAEWLRKPTFDQLMAVYPSAGGKKGVGGKAIIKCTVNTEGLMQECKIESESPADLGFGGAALALAPTFLMKPATKNGQAVESEVSIPINFIPNGAFTPNNSQAVTILSQPNWAQTPKMGEILAEITKKVGDKFADGKVVFQCDVNKKTGRIGDCVMANAAPGMVQFQGVARSLIPKFQLDPTTLADLKNKAVVNLAFSFPDMSSSTWDQRYLSRPQWKQTVAPDQNIFPKQAADAGLKTGLATVDCVVTATGALTQCKTISESVPGVGFGKVSEKIAQALIANPWTTDGLPADGAHVKLPIRLVDTGQGQPSSPASAPKP